MIIDGNVLFGGVGYGEIDIYRHGPTKKIEFFQAYVYLCQN